MFFPFNPRLDFCDFRVFVKELSFVCFQILSNLLKCLKATEEILHACSIELDCFLLEFFVLVRQQDCQQLIRLELPNISDGSASHG